MASAIELVLNGLMLGALYALFALGLSLISMFFIHTLQREEESLVIDCQQYCLEHLVNRLYEPDLSVSAPTIAHGMDVPASGMNLQKRVAR